MGVQKPALPESALPKTCRLGWGRMGKVKGWGSASPHRLGPRRQSKIGGKCPSHWDFQNGTESLSSDQGTTPPTPTAFPFRLQRMGSSDSAWGWARNELLFELAGLVLCLAAWAVTGCLPGLGRGRPQEGASRKSLTPRAAAATPAGSPLAPPPVMTLALRELTPAQKSEVRGQSQRSQHLGKSLTNHE